MRIALDCTQGPLEKKKTFIGLNTLEKLTFFLFSRKNYSELQKLDQKSVEIVF